MREIVFGQRGRIRYYHLTTDPQTLPPESTWYIMTNLDGKIRKTVGNTYGLRTWIEYGFKDAKNELGWADFRVTDYASIERWWELVRSRLSVGELAEPYFSASRQRVGIPSSRGSAHSDWSLFRASLVG
jgi:SRSO17 transposase